MNIGDIASASGIAALLAGAVIWYHEGDLEPLETGIQTQLSNIEADSVVSRLNRLYRIQCSPESTLAPDLAEILEAQLRRYHELTGREFSPPC